MRTGWRAGPVVLLLLLLGCAGAQLPAPASTGSAVLLEMGGQAEVIFAGTVVEVSRMDAAGYVDVRFHVDRAVRGCRNGASYVLREWAGLWTGGAVRYAAGQRRLMLLLARGPSGMSGPVGGTDGAVPLFLDADGIERVDLRWLRARARRGVAAASAGGPSLVGSADGGQVHADPFLDDWAGPVLPLASGGPGAPAAEPELVTVLGMLGGRGGV